jgi:hypothetical protein
MDQIAVAQAVVDLRRLARAVLDPAARRRAERAADRLVVELGPSLSKTRAARLLGISVTALDFWVARGALETVRKPGTQKAEVETSSLLELADEVAEVRAGGRRGGVIAHAVRRLDERCRSVASIVDAAALSEGVSTIASAG